MFSGEEICDALSGLGITHVVWTPDSLLGSWEEEFERRDDLQLVRACREGEAWLIAAGLHVGGARPVVMIQCTGMFESGDALRNALMDLRLPLFAVIGYRSYLVSDSPDSARKFTEPILKAWGLEHVFLKTRDDLPRLSAHFRDCESAGKPGIALIAEGRM
ncbi:MAG: hypothetical protein N2C14_32460 [Planctomycetales bacterium]